MTRNPADVATRKLEARSRALAQRAARPATDRVAVADGLAAAVLERYGAAPCVAAYVSYGGEPGTDDLRAALRDRGAVVLLPAVRGDDLAWVVDDGGPMARGGERNLPEPTGPEVGRGAAGLVAAGCRVLLLPALLVDATGVRLGKGGGYYDRLLADLPAEPAGPVRVAVVHDEELLAAGDVPAEEHDLAAVVDDVLTPSGRRLAPAPRPPGGGTGAPGED